MFWVELLPGASLLLNQGSWGCQIHWARCWPPSSCVGSRQSPYKTWSPFVSRVGHGCHGVSNPKAKWGVRSSWAILGKTPCCWLYRFYRYPLYHRFLNQSPTRTRTSPLLYPWGVNPFIPGMILIGSLFSHIYHPTHSVRYSQSFTMSVNIATPVIKTLEECAFDACNTQDLFNYLVQWWGTLIQKLYWPKLLSKLSIKEMERLLRSIPWDNPAARMMDFDIHKRRMKGMCFYGLFRFPFFFTRPTRFFNLFLQTRTLSSSVTLLSPTTTTDELANSICAALHVYFKLN